jgi:hypothetical protein
MSYVHGPHVEQLPSARARIAALREQWGKQINIRSMTNQEFDRVQEAQLTRLMVLDVADILLDAMRYGPDVGPIVDIPGRSQMQDQSPPGDAPTGLPPERSPTFKVGQAVCITAVPPSHNSHGLADPHGLIGRGASIIEIEPVQDWMTEPWYRLHCDNGFGFGSNSEGSLPQHCLNRVADP